jgi:hypothetical protein
MPHRIVALFFLAAMAPALAQQPAPEAAETALARQLEAAMQRAAGQDGPAFGLQVYCTDLQGIRAFDLFPSGVAIWKDATQLRLSGPQRKALLNRLLDAGFAEFEPLYGRIDEAEEADPAFRVSCQVALEIDGLEKSSAQMADGPQSEALTGLAAALLDQVEPLVADGVSAASLQDGLDKLANGVIAPEALKLRLLFLPAGEQGKAGSVLRIDAGRAARQVYSPGRELGTESWTALGPCRIAELARAIKQADLADIPVNLWSDDHIELAVQLLAYDKTVTARQFTRLKSKQPGASQQRFEALVKLLQTFEPALAASCGAAPDEPPK